MENDLVKPYCTEQDNIELAKSVLNRIFSDSFAAENGVEIKTIYTIGRDHGLVRGSLKKARKELGILSQDRNGIQFWYLPIKEEKS